MTSSSSVPSHYSVSVPDADIDLLKQKLAVSTFPDELEGAGWDLGSPLSDIKRLAEYWRDGFNWRAAEAKLNTLPQFKTNIHVDQFGDIGIHFIHQKSGQAGAIPLLFVHGWPGSYIEVTKLMTKLKGDTGGPAFDIVAPSLPNYAWSDGVSKRGFALKQYAETCHKVMLSLGYDQYVTQGGDWGFFITRAIGKLYPEHCMASHINMIRATAPEFKSQPLLALQHSLMPYTSAEKAGLERGKWFQTEGCGYRWEQSTKPQTLGYALADSPVALLSWIYEKLHDWTDSYPWTDDEILTCISIYWFSTAGPAASVRIYYESIHSTNEITRDSIMTWTPKVKMGLAYFPREIGLVPKTWGRTLGPVVYESEHERGGHFAAWEKPDAIAEDLAKMFGKGGSCFGVVKGRSGYARGANL